MMPTPSPIEPSPTANPPQPDQVQTCLSITRDVWKNLLSVPRNFSIVWRNLSNREKFFLVGAPIAYGAYKSSELFSPNIDQEARNNSVNYLIPLGITIGTTIPVLVAVALWKAYQLRQQLSNNSSAISSSTPEQIPTSISIEMNQLEAQPPYNQPLDQNPSPQLTQDSSSPMFQSSDQHIGMLNNAPQVENLNHHRPIEAVSDTRRPSPRASLHPTRYNQPMGVVDSMIINV